MTTKAISLNAKELSAAAKFGEITKAEAVEIESTETGIAPHIEIHALKFSMPDGWKRTGKSKDISDYDSW